MPPFFSLERAAAPYFGIKAYGVHMKGYVEIDAKKFLWVAKRSEDKPTFPGMLDHLVASGLVYNINADTTAGEIVAAVGAEKLILLTDVARILEDRNDSNSLIKEIDISVIQKMEEGKVPGGMIPKVECCIKSLTKGVSTASIIDGRVPHSLLLELLTDEGVWTIIRS